MANQLTITTNQTTLHSFLKADIPEGVKIISAPPIERRSIDWNINISLDINLTIDLTKITAFAFAIWFLNRIRRPQKEIEIKINHKQIPVNESEAIEFITKEIEHEQQKQNNND